MGLLVRLPRRRLGHLRRGERRVHGLQRRLDAWACAGSRGVHHGRAGHDVAEALAALAGPQHHREADQVEADAVDHAQDRAQRDLALVGRAARGALHAQAEQPLAERLAARSTRSRSSRRAPQATVTAARSRRELAAATSAQDRADDADHGQIHDTRGHTPVVQAGPGGPGGKLRYRVHMDSIGTNARAIRPGKTLLDASLQRIRRGEAARSFRRGASRARRAAARRSRSRRRPSARPSGRAGCRRPKACRWPPRRRARASSAATGRPRAPGTECTRSAVVPCCMTSPFSRSSISMASCAPASSALTSAGPQGAAPSKVLPGHPLRRLELVVARRQVVEQHVAGHVVQRSAPRARPCRACRSRTPPRPRSPPCCSTRAAPRWPRAPRGRSRTWRRTWPSRAARCPAPRSGSGS